MRTSIYIPDEARPLFDQAQFILGESSTSATIVSALKFVVDYKKESASTFTLRDKDREVKLICREILGRVIDDTHYMAYKTLSGKIIIEAANGNEHALIRFNDYDDFNTNGRQRIPIDLFRRVKLAIAEQSLYEYLD